MSYFVHIINLLKLFLADIRNHQRVLITYADQCIENPTFYGWGTYLLGYLLINILIL